MRGMDRDITRRDFLNGDAAGLRRTVARISLAGAVARTKRVSTARTNQTTGPATAASVITRTPTATPTRFLRPGTRFAMACLRALPANVIDTGETYDCVVVGGGISGLAAALIFQRKAGEGKTCLVLDNHPIFGGEAKRNEFLVDGHRLIAHQGSALFWPPYPHSFIARFYESIGLKTPRLEYQKWAGPAPEMPLDPHALSWVGALRLVFRSEIRPAAGSVGDRSWGKKLEGAPISAKAREELLRTQSDSGSAQKPQYRGDAISRRLDTITLEDHLMERSRHQPRNRPNISLRRRRRLRSRSRCAFRLYRICLR